MRGIDNFFDTRFPYTRGCTAPGESTPCAPERSSAQQPLGSIEPSPTMLSATHPPDANLEFPKFDGQAHRASTLEIAIAIAERFTPRLWGGSIETPTRHPGQAQVPSQTEDPTVASIP